MCKTHTSRNARLFPAKIAICFKLVVIFFLAPTQTHTASHLCLDTALHSYTIERATKKKTAFYKPTSLSGNYRLNAKMFTIILWFSTLWGHVSVLSDKQLNCLLCSSCCSFAEFQIESLHLKRNSCESA